MEEVQLSFASAKHDEHDASWSFVSVNHETLVCIVCLIEQMDDRDLSLVQRKLALTVFTGVMREISEVTTLFSSKPSLARHVVDLLIGLFEENDQFTEAAVEACFTLLQKVQSDVLMRHVLDSFQEQMQWVSDVKHIQPFLLLVGQLVACFEAFGALLFKHYEYILLQLTSVKTTDADIQSGIMFILVHLFFNSQQPYVSPTLKRKVCSLVVTSLNEANALDLQINLLALLKKLVRDPESAVLLVELGPSKQSLIAALKRVFVTRQDVLQTAAAHIVFTLLTSADTEVFVGQLLTSDLTEFIFEALHTQNGTQLESLFNVLHALTSFQPFFTRCHAVYGIESVLIAIGTLMRMKNFTILEKAFMLLDSMLVRQPTSIPLFVNTSSALHCLTTVDQGLHNNHLPVFTQVLSCTNHLFREVYLPRPHPYQLMVNMLKSAASKLNDLIQAPNQELIALYSAVVAAASRFCCPPLASSSKERQTPVVEDEAYITDIKNVLFEITEDHLLPWICKMWPETDSMVQKDIFHCFNSLYDVDKTKMADFSIRAAGSGVTIKVIVLKGWTRDDMNEMKSILDNFLLNVFTQLVERDVLMYTQLPDWFQRGLQNLKILHWELDDLLLVKELESRQVLITTLYFSYIYGFTEWSAEDVLHVITSFLSGCSDFSSLPLLCLKHCLFLCSWAHCNDAATNTLYESQVFRSLLTMLSTCSLEAWYTHHPVMFMWTFSNTLLADTWGDKLLEYWLPTISLSNLDNNHTSDPDVELLADLVYSENFLKSLLKLTCRSKEELSNTTAHIGKWIISKLECMVGDEPESVVVLCFMYEQSSRELHDMFLQQTEASDYQLSNVLSLLTQLMTVQHQTEDIDSWNVKSVYHLVKHVGSVYSMSSASLYQSLLYLAKFSELSGPDFKRVIPVMTQNVNFMRTLNQCLTSNDMALVDVVSRIIAWMASYPREIQTSCPIQVSSDYLLKSLNRNCDELTLGLLGLISAALLPGSDGSGPLVFTKDSVLEDVPFFTAHDVRLIYIHLQQFVCQDNVRVRNLAVRCVERLLKYAASAHGDLVVQLLSHPWNKLWLETLLQFDSEDGLSTETANLVLLMSSRPEGEAVISQVCDVFLLSLSNSTLSPQCATLLMKACLLEKRFITEHAQLDLLTSARRNVVRVSSDDVTVEELTEPPV